MARPAMQLMVAACRRALGSPPGDDIAALVSSVSDWPELVACVHEHAVAPLVFAPLAETGSVPAGALAQLRAAVDENALRSLVLTSMLRDIVPLLEQHDIPVIPIKGPLLARSAYGNLASRRFADLDLVIHRRDLDRARGILAQRGFAPAIPLARDAEAAVLDADYHVALAEPAHNIMVELHWALIRSGLAGLRDESWAWTNAEHTTALGAPMRTLTNDATFVFLCVHGSKHLWTQLGWLCDLAALARNAPPSWTAVEQLAKAAGATRMVGLGCALAASVLGAPVPDLFARDRHVRDAVADINARLFAAQAKPKSDLAFQWSIRTRLSDRVSMVADVLAAPHVADARVNALPRRARALYYGLRPLRLFKKHGLRLLGR